MDVNRVVLAERSRTEMSLHVEREMADRNGGRPRGARSR